MTDLSKATRWHYFTFGPHRVVIRYARWMSCSVAGQLYEALKYANQQNEWGLG